MRAIKWRELTKGDKAIVLFLLAFSAFMFWQVFIRPFFNN